MLNNVENARSKWGGRHTAIDNWLQERQKLLKQYCHLAGIDGSSSGVLPSIQEIDDFCGLLMDYVSAGHFEIYEMLVGEDKAGQQLKHETYPKLATTTDKALAFNDGVAGLSSVEDAASFEATLATLGQTLEDRFALEDELIQHMASNPERSESIVE